MCLEVLARAEQDSRNRSHLDEGKNYKAKTNAQNRQPPQAQLKSSKMRCVYTLLQVQMPCQMFTRPDSRCQVTIIRKYQLN